MKTEINGHKFEIPEPIALRVETMKVGQRVAVLKKNNYSPHEVCHGVIVGFEPFPSLPTVTVAFIEGTGFSETPKVRVAAFNEQTKDLELVLARDDEDRLDFDRAMQLLTRRVKDTHTEYMKAVAQQEYFVQHWGQYSPAPSEEPKLEELQS